MDISHSMELFCIRVSFVSMKAKIKDQHVHDAGVDWTIS